MRTNASSTHTRRRDINPPTVGKKKKLTTMVVETFKSSRALLCRFASTHVVSRRRLAPLVRGERLDAMPNERNERGRMDEIIAVKNYSQCFLV